MAIYHCSIKILSRSTGGSAVGAAAYRSGEKLINERDGVTHDYTKKQDVVYGEIIAPKNAPDWATDRERLWNEVEIIEKGEKAQLARKIDFALPNELTFEQNKELAREYMQTFADKGMVVDWNMHMEDGNNHVDAMVTMRPFKEDGSWDVKQRKEYILDKDGHKRYDKKSKTYKCTTVKTTNWDHKDTLENWRKDWADIANKHLERAGIDQRIDHRSNKDQGLEEVPQIHLGPNVIAMEQKGIPTERGDKYREIAERNKHIKELKTQIKGLQADRQELYKIKMGGKENVRPGTIQFKPCDKQLTRWKTSENDLYDLHKLDVVTNTKGNNLLLSNNVQNIMGRGDESGSGRLRRAEDQPGITDKENTLQTPQKTRTMSLSQSEIAKRAMTKHQECKAISEQLQTYIAEVKDDKKRILAPAMMDAAKQFYANGFANLEKRDKQSQVDRAQLAQDIEVHENNKPKFFGRDKWEREADIIEDRKIKFNTEYNSLQKDKETHQALIKKASEFKLTDHITTNKIAKIAEDIITKRDPKISETLKGVNNKLNELAKTENTVYTESKRFEKLANAIKPTKTSHDRSFTVPIKPSSPATSAVMNAISKFTDGGAVGGLRVPPVRDNEDIDWHMLTPEEVESKIKELAVDRENEGITR